MELLFFSLKYVDNFQNKHFFKRNFELMMHKNQKMHKSISYKMVSC